MARVGRPFAWMRAAAVHHALRRASAQPGVSRDLLHGGVDRHHRSLRAEPYRTGDRQPQRPLDAARAVPIRLLSARAGGGTGDGAGLDAACAPRHLRRGGRARVVLCRDMDRRADAGDQLGRLALRQVHGFSADAAGAAAAGGVPDRDGILLPAWLLAKATAYNATL